VRKWRFREWGRIRMCLFLAMDTCDSRGSVAVLRDDVVLYVVVHETSEELLVLAASGRGAGSGGFRRRDGGVDGYAVAAGPARLRSASGIDYGEGVGEVYGNGLRRCRAWRRSRCRGRRGARM